MQPANDGNAPSESTARRGAKRSDRQTRWKLGKKQGREKHTLVVDLLEDFMVRFFVAVKNNSSGRRKERKGTEGLDASFDNPVELAGIRVPVRIPVLI